MNDEIVQQELQLARHNELINGRASLDEATRGQARIFYAAVLALIVVHPRSDLLDPVLRGLLTQVEESMQAPEFSGQLDGAIAARGLLLTALGQAHERAAELP